VIDIASPEELFEHDGPLLAEDSDLYHFETYSVRAEPQVTDRVQEHVNKVMEQIKARKQDEMLHRFFDSGSEASEKLLEDTMASLQAAQERMELRARATAALQAATQRAAAATSAPKLDPDTNSEKDPPKPPPEPPVQFPQVAKRPPVAPGHAAFAAAATSKRPNKASVPETLEDRINRVMAEAKTRTLTAQAEAPTAHNFENFEEQTTTASSYSATDSGSESGAEWQPNVFWGPAPR
jgi:hypothetical protein